MNDARQAIVNWALAGVLPRDALRVREAAGDLFESFGGIYIGTTYLTGDGQAERYDGAFADGHIFDVTGVAPEVGRTIGNSWLAAATRKSEGAPRR